MDKLIVGYPAAVRVLGQDAPDLVALARKQALEPSIFAERPPFFFQAEISSNRVDAYFTRMHETTLRNFAAEAAAGVPLQNSHNQWSLSLGRSLTGAFEDVGGGVQRVVADFYIVPGLKLSEVATDDVIAGIRSGVVSDVSVGFWGGGFRCAVCGNDLFGPDCRHIPGLTYDVVENGQVTGKVLATAWVENAHLGETSIVYHGATPGAAVIKAEAEAQAGRLGPDTVRFLEQRYRIHLPEPRRVFAGVSVGVTNKEGEDVDMTQLRAVLAEFGAVVEPEGDGLAAVRALGERVRAAEQEAARLRPLADMGQTYRADLIEQTVREGVRASGNDFPAETIRGLLAGQDLDAIKAMLDHYRKLADAIFQGGRRSVDAVDPAPGQETGKGDGEQGGGQTWPDFPFPDEVYKS